MAERLVNELIVNRPIDEAWPVICDLGRIAPCLPGAQLESVDGDTYHGTVTVKLGPITAEFAGEARFDERDDDAHRARLVAQGRGVRGGGRAKAVVEAVAEPASATSTRCIVTTDLQITGKVAQLGRGVVGDVSRKLMGEFASNLDALLSTTTAPSAPEARAAPLAEPQAVRDPVAPATIGSAPVAKLLAPLGVVVALLLLWRRTRR